MTAEIIEGKYAASSGPGPWHLLMQTEDGPKILCGVRRIMLIDSMRRFDIDRVCIQCLNRRRQKLPKLTPPDPALIDEAAAVLAEVVDARGRFSKQMGALRGAQGERIDALLKLAYANGYTMAELGLMLGLTRERIRQRIADVPGVAG